MHIIKVGSATKNFSSIERTYMYYAYLDTSKMHTYTQHRERDRLRQ